MKQPESTGHTGAWTRENTGVNPNLPKQVPHYTWLRSIFVAIFLILVIGGAAILLGKDKQRPADWVYINALTGKKNVQLPDGSKVMLRQGSSVAYPADFGKDSRNLTVKGEAYFEVSYNPAVPFSINSIKGITTDKGTSFILRSNDTVEVLLVSNGRVKFESIENKGGFVVLGSGQKAQIAGKQVVTSPAGENNLLAWTNEQLIFNRTPLKQVTSDLHNFYGVPIRVATDIESEKIFITARFDNQPLTKILQDIGVITGLSVKDEAGGVILIKPMVAQQPTAPTEAEKMAGTKKVVTNSIMQAPDTATGVNSKITKKNKKKWWKVWNKRS
jgi:ferric-dicitrate binding protein FerR (iron transport regulator)